MVIALVLLKNTLSLFCFLFRCFWKTHMFCSLFRCYWMMHTFILLFIVSVLLKDTLYHSFIVLFIVSELLKNTLYHSLIVLFIVSLLLKSTLFWSLFQGYWSIHCIIVLFTVSALLKDTLSVSWHLQTVFHLGRYRWKRRHGMLSSRQKPTTFPQVGFAMLGRCSVYLQTYKQLFSPTAVDWPSKRVSCTWAKSCQVAIYQIHAKRGLKRNVLKL